MKRLFKNIKELSQVRTTHLSVVSGSDMNVLPTIKNAYLIVEKGLIKAFGSMKDCPTETNHIDSVYINGEKQNE